MSPSNDAQLEETFQSYRLASSFLLSQLKINGFLELPKIGIICGSGLSELSKTLQSPITIEYKCIPGFPPSTGVEGHKGEVVFGYMWNGTVPAMCFRGRFHSYEGHDMNTVALPARVMRCLGVKLMIVTNAAGGIHPDYNVGDIVCVQDYFALPMLAGNNPLVGHNDDVLGPRFPPTSNVFDADMQRLVMKSAKQCQMDEFLRTNGTYCFVSGPMYESKAECRFLRSIGGDCVGMSTVPEIVAAHHAGIKVICLSLITNKVVVSGDEGPPASHKEVLDAVEKRSNQIQGLVTEIVHWLSKDGVLDSIPDLPRIDLNLDSSANDTCRISGHCLRSFAVCPFTRTVMIGLLGGSAAMVLRNIMSAALSKKR
jgi:purine-nucleoside phosphorylase